MISETISVLSVLAAVINEAHEKTTRRTLEETSHAIRAGDALLAAKVIAPRDTFDAWINAFCHCKHDEADNYMSLARDAGAFLPLFTTVTKPE